MAVNEDQTVTLNGEERILFAGWTRFPGNLVSIKASAAVR
jgi:hypothetical protein